MNSYIKKAFLFNFLSRSVVKDRIEIISATWGNLSWVKFQDIFIDENKTLLVQLSIG